MGGVLPEDELDRLQRAVAALTPQLRTWLLEVLLAPYDSRAPQIGEFFGRPDTRGLAEFLIDLETDGFSRAAMIDALRFGRGETT